MSDSQTTALPVGWGILGTGDISDIVAGQCAGAPLVDLRAVSSRSAERADAFAAAHAIALASDDAGEVIAAPSVEAVYIALPHALHVDAVLACLDAGKHVLCEKPFVANPQDAARIFAHPAARRLVVTEGFMVRYQPQWRWIEETLASGRIGKLTSVLWHSAVVLPGKAADPTREVLAGDGSLLLDVGCYAVHLIRTIFGADPARASASMGLDGEGRDLSVDGMLDFGPDAGSAHLFVAHAKTRAGRVHIVGEDGSIELFNPIHAPGDMAKLVLTTAEGSETLEFPTAGQYGLQMQAVSEAIRGGAAPLVGASDITGNVRTIDALRRSAATGGDWAEV